VKDLAPGTSAFLGVGWSHPISATNGLIERAAYEESVRQAIWLVLGTSPGERVMRPAFGCGIPDLVFGVNDSTTAGRVADEVRDALVRWEPRIDVLDVGAASDPDEPQTLLVRIDYRVRATNNVFNLVYPFYLEGRA
jgi:phage baseplate assembly protein W